MRQQASDYLLSAHGQPTTQSQVPQCEALRRRYMMLNLLFEQPPTLSPNNMTNSYAFSSANMYDSFVQSISSLLHMDIKWYMVHSKRVNKTQSYRNFQDTPKKIHLLRYTCNAYPYVYVNQKLPFSLIVTTLQYLPVSKKTMITNLITHFFSHTVLLLIDVYP